MDGKADAGKKRIHLRVAAADRGLQVDAEPVRNGAHAEQFIDAFARREIRALDVLIGH
ncbi:MAG: hypothetical protein FD148_2005 [Methylocystaceae bacterium]|nr:MAG: hypothetical protein FD148_2005 [Methylocystaceae bacterium]